MFKYIIKVLYLSIIIWVLLCSGGAFGLHAQEEDGLEVIRIEVEGNKNISDREVRSSIGTKKGKPFSTEQLDEDLQSIYDLEFFSNVEVDVQEVEEGVVVTFLVTERPIIKKIELRGRESLSSHSLKEEITLKKRGAFDEDTMEDDRIRIVSLYKDKGYANVKVEAYSTVDEESGKIEVVFFIIEGEQITVGNVDVVGVEAFKKKKILKLLKKTRRKKVFKEDLFQEDLDRIRLYYRNRGYLEVSTGEPEITYTDEETKINIVLYISEGVKYNVGDVSFSGNSILTDEELSEAIALRKEHIYSQEKYELTKLNIEALYADRGYVFMRVEGVTDTNETDKIVDLKFEVTEGPLVYVGKIFITGNDKTRDYVIRREILLKEGDPFNRSKLQRSQQKIYNLGFFKEVNLTPRPAGMEKLDLIFDLLEQQTNTISAGIGYSTVDKLLGTVELGINNLFGRGQRLSMSSEIGNTKQYYEVDFTEPWLFNKPYSFGLGVYDKRRAKEYHYSYLDDEGNDAEKDDQYSEERRGGSIRLGRRFWDFYTARVAYKYERVAITEVNADNTDLLEKQNLGWETTSSITTTLDRDSRDNIFDPTRGTHHSVSAEVAGGILSGTHHFTKYIGDTSWYFPTIGRFILAFHARAGIADTFNPSNEVPIYERFFIGGAETVRGYDYFGHIGPTDGSVSMLYMNVEYKYTIPSTPIQLAIFYDAGNSWGTIQHDSYDLKEGIGAGLRFITPVFPIRIDYGHGLQHKPGEAKSQWYFSIGQVF
ncbi:MAG: outer membrane protein assembly factor BamA [bacterium]